MAGLLSLRHGASFQDFHRQACASVFAWIVGLPLFTVFYAFLFFVKKSEVYFCHCLRHFPPKFCIAFQTPCVSTLSDSHLSRREVVKVVESAALTLRSDGCYSMDSDRSGLQCSLFEQLLLAEEHFYVPPIKEVDCGARWLLCFAAEPLLLPSNPFVQD